jgi:hypothetical protein
MLRRGTPALMVFVVIGLLLRPIAPSLCGSMAGDLQAGGIASAMDEASEPTADLDDCTGTPKATLNSVCDIACTHSMLTVRSVALLDGQDAPTWHAAPAQSHQGFTSSIEPYPPNLSA